MIKYLSLFTGIGGFEIGILNAYVESTNRKKNGGSKKDSKRVQGQRLVPETRKNARTEERSIGELLDWSNDKRAPHCVGYSEIDKYAIEIYQKHFPKHKNYGDIKKIKEQELPDFDLLVGGFPCQSFSIAGQRKGFADTRGTLFFDIARILRRKQPRLLLLENVKGLLSHDNGNTFKTIIATLDELGYDVQWQVLNSKNFGVPQNRERILIVGHLRGTRRPKVFPIGESAGTNNELPRHITNTLTTRYEGGQATGSYIGESKFNAQTKVGTYRTHKSGQGFREKKDGLVPTIPARAREDGSGQPVILQRERGFNKGGKHEIAPTMGSHSWEQNNHLMKGMRVRRLTPTECERLQGFPDGWTDGVSDTQRYKTLGNAVTTNVIQSVMEKLL